LRVEARARLDDEVDAVGLVGGRAGKSEEPEPTGKGTSPKAAWLEPHTLSSPECSESLHLPRCHLGTCISHHHPCSHSFFHSFIHFFTAQVKETAPSGND